MIIAPAFRSANTVRMTVPRQVRQALNLLPGNRVMFSVSKPGVVEMRNADALINAGLLVGGAK